MTPLEEILRDRIARQGPITFADYMETCLYHPGLGYYARAPRTGWDGHFVTSPELDPGFGRLWAEGIEQIWAACGRPDSFDVVEVGPGEGGLAEGIMTTLGERLETELTYHLVERAGRVEGRQRSRLEGRARLVWHSSLEGVPPAGAGCVIANEVLDNLPVHVVSRRGRELLESFVAVSDEGLTFELGSVSSTELAARAAAIAPALEEGASVEVGLEHERLIQAAADRIGRGILVLIDYGAHMSELAGRPAGTMLAHSVGVDDDVLARPGERDISAFVNWTAMAAACRSSRLVVAGPFPQRSALDALGASDLDAELAGSQRRALAGGRGAEAVRALSRRQALAALRDPGGLGGLEVLVGLKRCPPPPWLEQLAG